MFIVFMNSSNNIKQKFEKININDVFIIKRQKIITKMQMYLFNVFMEITGGNHHVAFNSHINCVSNCKIVDMK